MWKKKKKKRDGKSNTGMGEQKKKEKSDTEQYCSSAWTGPYLRGSSCSILVHSTGTGKAKILVFAGSLLEHASQDGMLT
jgi:hypothetical protein